MFSPLPQLSPLLEILRWQWHKLRSPYLYKAPTSWGELLKSFLIFILFPKFFLQYRYLYELFDTEEPQASMKGRGEAILISSSAREEESIPIYHCVPSLVYVVLVHIYTRTFAQLHLLPAPPFVRLFGVSFQGNRNHVCPQTWLWKIVSFFFFSCTIQLEGRGLEVMPQ